MYLYYVYIVHGTPTKIDKLQPASNPTLKNDQKTLQLWFKQLSHLVASFNQYNARNQSNIKSVFLLKNYKELSSALLLLRTFTVYKIIMRSKKKVVETQKPRRLADQLLPKKKRLYVLT